MIMKQIAQALAILCIGISMVISINTGTATGAENQKAIAQPQQPVVKKDMPAKMATIPSLNTLNLTVTVLNSAEISLKWNVLDCGGHRAYRIDKKKGGAAYSQLALRASGETSFTDIEVAPNTSYTYRLYLRCGDTDIYSKDVTITTGDDNPYAETLVCPRTVQKHTTTPSYGAWTGYDDYETATLDFVRTQDGNGPKQTLKCYYKTCISCDAVTIYRDVPAGSCRKTESAFMEKSFKCKKGAF
jgi:hypothetical protein